MRKAGGREEGQEGQEVRRDPGGGGLQRVSHLREGLGGGVDFGVAGVGLGMVGGGVAKHATPVDGGQVLLRQRPHLRVLVRVHHRQRALVATQRRLEVQRNVALPTPPPHARAHSIMSLRRK